MMGVQIARESDGRVSIAVAQGSQATTTAVVVSPVEARLLAIKLLLAAEDVKPSS